MVVAEVAAEDGVPVLATQDPEPDPGGPSRTEITIIVNGRIVETPDKGPGSTVYGREADGALLEDQAIRCPAARLQQRGGGGHLRAGRPSGARRGVVPLIVVSEAAAGPGDRPTPSR